MYKTTWLSEFFDVIKTNQNNHLYILFHEGEIDKKQRAHLAKLKEEPMPICSTCYIGKDTSFLPFLTVKDNLLLGVSKEEFPNYIDDIRFWLHFFKIEIDTLAKKSSQLSFTNSILLQIIRFLAKQKKNLIINDIELHLSEIFIDSLLPTLIQITKEKDIQILFITNNTTLLSQKNREQIIIFNKDMTPRFTKLTPH